MKVNGKPTIEFHLKRGGGGGGGGGSITYTGVEIVPRISEGVVLKRLGKRTPFQVVQVTHDIEADHIDIFLDEVIQ